MTEPSEAQQIMDEIVADYGLTKLSDRALARAMAEALCADPVNPGTVTALRAALPPRPGAAAGEDRPLAKLDDETLMLATSVALAIEGKPDPNRSLLRLSALRQRCAMLEQANEYMKARLRAAELKARSRVEGGANAAGVPVDGDRAPGPHPEAFDNGLPGKHAVRLAVSNPPPKPISEHEAKLRAQRQASEDHAARLLGGLDGGGEYADRRVSYERGDL